MLKITFSKLLERLEVRVTTGYIILGIIWILFSDYLIKYIAASKTELSQLQSYKGIFYIFISGLFVYFLARREMTRKEKLEHKMLLKEKELQRLIVQSEERERNRISQDLHDGLQQKLAGLSLFSESLLTSKNLEKQVKLIKDLVDDCIKETRNITFNLSSNYLEQKGLKLALEEMVENINTLKIISFYVDCSVNEKNIPYLYKNNIYRIIQELVTNTIKHANAKNIDLHIWEENHVLKITYSDDGEGLSLENHKQIKKGQGLNNIKKRVRMLSGSMDTGSNEKGFNLTIDFDLERNFLLRAV